MPLVLEGARVSFTTAEKVRVPFVAVILYAANLLELWLDAAYAAMGVAKTNKTSAANENTTTSDAF